MNTSESDEVGGMIFFGNPVEIVPRRLIASPQLTSDDKVGWMLMRILSHHSVVSDIEHSETFARMLSSQPEVDFEHCAQVIARLRLTRWIVRCGETDSGHLFGIYDEQASALDVLQLDEQYPAFVEATCQTPDPGTRELAQKILEQLRQETD